MSKQQIGDISGKNYSFQHRPRNGRKGGGVGILCKHSLKSKLLPYTPIISFKHIELSIATSKAHVRLVVIYRPTPSTKNKFTVNQFLTGFATFLEMLTISQGHLLIVGDFNFHIDDPSNPAAQKFLNRLDF